MESHGEPAARESLGLRLILGIASVLVGALLAVRPFASLAVLMVMRVGA